MHEAGHHIAATVSMCTRGIAERLVDAITLLLLAGCYRITFCPPALCNLSTKNVCRRHEWESCCNATVPVVDPFQQVRSKAGSCPTCHRVTQHKPLQTVAAICFPVNNIKDFLMVLFALREPRRPIVPRTTTFLWHPHVFIVVQGFVF